MASLVDANYIIDDGLVIRKGSIVCGRSAKSERNQISAIRRALFEYDDHRREVVSFFRSVSPCSVMVIATSDNMALKILRKLCMPAPEQIVHIEDVATPEEIVKARRERFGKGQHVIPVSHVLVRKNFAGKLVGQLRVFWKSKDKHEGEKTIVRPPFSFHGEVHIETEAIEQLASFIAGRTAQVVKVNEVKASTGNDETLAIDLKLTVAVDGRNLMGVAALVKERIAASIRYFTGLDVRSVNVIIVEVVV